MKILFVPINYNAQTTTENYIKNIFSLKGYNPESVHITVIDNSKNFINEKFSNVEVIKTDNPGYFQGINVALRKDNITEYKYIIVGNNDIAFDHDFISKLKEVDHSNPVISPRIWCVDGFYQNPHVIKDLSLLRLFYLKVVYSTLLTYVVLPKLVKLIFPISIRKKDEQQYQKQMYISQGHGSCFILTQKYLELFGTLPEQTFLNGEEFFLSHQLNEKNIKILYEPKLGLTHLEHTTTGVLKRKAMYLHQKNAFSLESLIRKNYKSTYGYTSL